MEAKQFVLHPTMKIHDAKSEIHSKLIGLSEVIKLRLSNVSYFKQLDHQMIDQYSVSSPYLLFTAINISNRLNSYQHFGSGISSTPDVVIILQ